MIINNINNNINNNNTYPGGTTQYIQDLEWLSAQFWLTVCKGLILHWSAR